MIKNFSAYITILINHTHNYRENYISMIINSEHSISFKTQYINQTNIKLTEYIKKQATTTI